MRVPRCMNGGRGKPRKRRVLLHLHGEALPGTPGFVVVEVVAETYYTEDVEVFNASPTGEWSRGASRGPEVLVQERSREELQATPQEVLEMRSRNLELFPDGPDAEDFDAYIREEEETP